MLDQNANKYWETVVNTIQDGVMIVDTGGTIIYVNQSFESITGYTQSEILGKSCKILLCSACDTARKDNDCHFCVMFKKGELNRQKCELVRNDGHRVHVLKNASVLRDRKGKIRGAVETLTDITDLTEKENQIECFRRELQAENRFCGMIGNSPQMQQIFELIGNAAASDAPVIIYGESGTGKELVAKAIHEKSRRHSNPYVKVNCSALNESLLESELFGHVKGAFTGVFKNREGRFEAARKGDIFLDEIGDLPLSTQVKLLRVLEEKVVERVGDHRPLNIDVRIISATNRDLGQLVSEGRFREDFYYRINVIPIFLPALRERKTDIPILAEAFIQRIGLKSGKNIKGMTQTALEVIMNYDWPGNVRELKSAFEYAFVSCHENMIAPKHLPPNISNNSPTPSALETRPDSLNEIKKKRLIDALKKTGGNQSEAARILNISRTSVWSQIKRYGLKY